MYTCTCTVGDFALLSNWIDFATHAEYTAMY